MPTLALIAIMTALAAGVEPRSPPAAPPDPASEPDPDDAPPGSAEERALLRRARDTNEHVTTDRAATTPLHLRAKAAVGRLQAMAAAGAIATERARELEREVVEAWTANITLLRSQWPVDPTRACRYDQLHLESAMRLSEAQDRAHQVAENRKDLEACLARADAALARLARSSKALAHEVAEVEKATAAFSETTTAAPQGK